MNRRRMRTMIITDSRMPSFLRPEYGANPVPKLVYNIHGRPRPIMMLNVLLPKAFETAMLPNPLRAATADAT